MNRKKPFIVTMLAAIMLVGLIAVVATTAIMGATNQ